ncbi:hypothetical protein N7455_008754 [Penicillium solitum]|uniref:uncharacterized protein n=1 Tax=Penicillium solitum TaxID=60172 RepID=UPI0017D170E9|nr:hypothetical protein HAV15_008516 [Penicillium sp. str. \
MSAVCESCEPGNYGDHDVTGFGVLIPFGVSIIMLGTVVIGYIGGFLREDRYNAIDTMILHTFHGAFRGSKGITKANENRSIEEIQDLEGFVLTMSDQQLITGFSLILATNLIRYGVADLDKTISGYSYCIAMSLALLSRHAPFGNDRLMRTL